MSFPVLPLLCLQNSGIHLRSRLYSALFYGSLLFISPSADSSWACFVFRLSFPAFLVCPRGYSLRTPTPSGTDGILQSPFWLFQHKRGVLEKTLAAICRTAFSQQNSSTSWGAARRCVRCIAATFMQNHYYQLPNLGCFYRICIKI